MSRKPNMLWRKSDAKKLEREINRFNNKIYRIRHKNPEMSKFLPDTIKKSDKLKLIEEFKNSPRNEFNKAINSLDRFVRKGSEKLIQSKTGNTVTKWEKNEVSLKVAQVNRARTLEREKRENLDVTSRGKPVGLKRGEMGSERMIKLEPKTFNFDKIKGGKEWEKYKDSINKMASSKAKQERNDSYKENYIKGLENSFGEYARDIIETIEKIPSDIVVETYYKEQEASIEFFYEKQAMELKLNVMSDIWNRVVNENEKVING